MAVAAWWWYERGDLGDEFTWRQFQIALLEWENFMSVKIIFNPTVIGSYQ